MGDKLIRFQAQDSVLGARSRYWGPNTGADKGGQMTAYTSSLLRLLSERGYVHQMTDASALDALANRQIVPGYIGSIHSAIVCTWFDGADHAASPSPAGQAQADRPDGRRYRQDR